MINAPLIEETIAHIRAFPELHSQTYFFEQNEFGLAACFAGRALLLGGYTPVLNMEDMGVGNVALHPVTGERVPCFSEAQQLLGLDSKWAHNLFTPINTTTMLEIKAKDLLNGSPLDTYYELVFERPC